MLLHVLTVGILFPMLPSTAVIDYFKASKTLILFSSSLLSASFLTNHFMCRQPAQKSSEVCQQLQGQILVFDMGLQEPLSIWEMIQCDCKTWLEC